MKLTSATNWKAMKLGDALARQKAVTGNIVKDQMEYDYMVEFNKLCSSAVAQLHVDEIRKLNDNIEKLIHGFTFGFEK